MERLTKREGKHTVRVACLSEAKIVVGGKMRDRFYKEGNNVGTKN